MELNLKELPIRILKAEYVQTEKKNSPKRIYEMPKIYSGSRKSNKWNLIESKIPIRMKMNEKQILIATEVETLGETKGESEKLQNLISKGCRIRFWTRRRKLEFGKINQKVNQKSCKSGIFDMGANLIHIYLNRFFSLSSG